MKEYRSVLIDYCKREDHFIDFQRFKDKDETIPYCGLVFYQGKDNPCKHLGEIDETDFTLCNKKETELTDMLIDYAGAIW